MFRQFGVMHHHSLPSHVSLHAAWVVREVHGWVVVAPRLACWHRSVGRPGPRAARRGDPRPDRSRAATAASVSAIQLDLPTQQWWWAHLFRPALVQILHGGGRGGAVATYPPQPHAVLDGRLPPRVDVRQQPPLCSGRLPPPARLCERDSGALGVRTPSPRPLRTFVVPALLLRGPTGASLGVCVSVYHAAVRELLQHSAASVE
jgi:hypothetical protein